jgi:hypothetical protein
MYLLKGGLYGKAQGDDFQAISVSSRSKDKDRGIKTRG